MKRPLQIQFACLCLGLSFSMASHAETPVPESLHSVLAIQIFQKAAGELRTLCARHFPDLTTQLDEAYASSALMKTVVSIRVNGQEIHVKETDSFALGVNEFFDKDDEAKKRKTCTGYSTLLAQWFTIGVHAQELGQQAQEQIDLAARRRAKQEARPTP